MRTYTEADLERAMAFPYSGDVSLALVAQLIADVRRETLEEADGACEALGYDGCEMTANRIRDRIRGLK